jgi:hypothetical protein
MKMPQSKGTTRRVPDGTGGQEDRRWNQSLDKTLNDQIWQALALPPRAFSCSTPRIEEKSLLGKTSSLTLQNVMRPTGFAETYNDATIRSDKSCDSYTRIYKGLGLSMT